jgi:hypothetical protein
MMKIIGDYRTSVWMHQIFESNYTWEKLYIDEDVWVVRHFFGIGVSTYLHESFE